MGEISRELTCTTEEYEGHTHGDACYITEITSEPLCMLDHAHEDTCFIAGYILDCDIPESEGHSHGDECYTVEMGVVCEIPEEGHTHTEECYDRKQLCGVETEAEMHRHTEDCFAQITVTYSEPVLICELEEADKWELAVPTELSGVYAQDLLAVAESQIGYEQDEEDVLVDATTGAVSYASRYGLWYGQPYEEWNTLFVMYCLEKAGIGEDVMPRNADAQVWMEALTAADQYRAEDYVPQAGDLVFRQTEDGVRVGVLSADGMYSIEGNLNGTVAEAELYDVLGYGVSENIVEEEYEEMAPESYFANSIMDTLSETDSGIRLDKRVSYQGTGNYLLTLEAYSVGTKESKPTDVIFIIDQSCSMYSPVDQKAQFTNGSGSIECSKMTYDQLLSINMNDNKNARAGLEGYYVAVCEIDGGCHTGLHHHAIPLRYQNGWQRTTGDGSKAQNGDVICVSETIQEIWYNNLTELTPEYIN